MLRVPWSKIRSVGDTLLQVLRVIGVFQGSILRVFVHSEYFRARYSGILLVLEVFRIWSLSLLPVLGVFGASILWNTAVLRVVWGSLLWNTRCTRNIWGSCTAPTLRSRSISYCKKFNTRGYFRVSYSEVRVILGVVQCFILLRYSGLEYFSE